MPLLRTSLLVRCTEEEAAAIRHAVKQEHRTASAYILHRVMGRIEHQKQLEEQWRKTRPANGSPRKLIKYPGAKDQEPVDKQNRRTPSVPRAEVQGGGAFSLF